MKQVSQAKAMLTKINFPREALIIAGFGETLFNFAIRSFLLVPILFYFRIGPSILSLVLFFPALLVLIAVGTTIGLLLTPLAVLYQDIEKGIPMILPFLMFFSGVLVPVPHEGIGLLLASCNPVYPVLETCRNFLTGQPAVLLPQTMIVAVGSVVLLFAGWVLYRLAMPHLISRLGG